MSESLRAVVAVNAAAVMVLAKVSASPDPAGLPGSSVAERLINGLFFYTLLACLAGLLISVVVWVFFQTVVIPEAVSLKAAILRASVSTP